MTARSILTAVSLIVGAIVGAHPVSAKTVTAAPSNAVVMFQVRHDLGYTIGHFKDFSATLELTDDGNLASAKAKVKTGSLHTRNPVRDEGLRSGLFLDVEKFPEAAFESVKMQGSQLEGVLTIKGISKPIVLKVERSGNKMVLSGSFDRLDYGMNFNQALAKKKKSIGNTVDLTVELPVN